jgi:hypothetical protein
MDLNVGTNYDDGTINIKTNDAKIIYKKQENGMAGIYFFKISK